LKSAEISFKKKVWGKGGDSPRKKEGSSLVFGKRDREKGTAICSAKRYVLEVTRLEKSLERTLQEKGGGNQRMRGAGYEAIGTKMSIIWLLHSERKKTLLTPRNQSK